MIIFWNMLSNRKSACTHVYLNMVQADFLFIIKDMRIISKNYCPALSAVISSVLQRLHKCL